MEPSYLALHESGELARRAAGAAGALEQCRLCPRKCGADRRAGELGFCQTGARAKVASYNLHYGEEAPLVGTGGSGTIFFAMCNLGCVFCQNWDISHEDAGFVEAEPEDLAGVMLDLQAKGAHNINFVTPSHVVPQILQALDVACAHGLCLPLVYNTSAYDRVSTLRLLDGVVDIYMPDAKMADPEASAVYLQARDYPERARAAIREMHRQVGDLALDADGVAVRGLLVRHLVMPGGLAGTDSWMRFLGEEISRNTYVNIMDQYRPCGRAPDMPAIASRPTEEDYRRAVDTARSHGITRLDDRLDRVACFFRRLQ